MQNVVSEAFSQHTTALDSLKKLENILECQGVKNVFDKLYKGHVRDAEHPISGDRSSLAGRVVGLAVFLNEKLIDSSEKTALEVWLKQNRVEKDPFKPNALKITYHVGAWVSRVLRQITSSLFDTLFELASAISRVQYVVPKVFYDVSRHIIFFATFLQFAVTIFGLVNEVKARRTIERYQKKMLDLALVGSSSFREYWEKDRKDLQNSISDTEKTPLQRLAALVIEKHRDLKPFQDIAFERWKIDTALTTIGTALGVALFVSSFAFPLIPLLAIGVALTVAGLAVMIRAYRQDYVLRPLRFFAECAPALDGKYETLWQKFRHIQYIPRSWQRFHYHHTCAKYHWWRLKVHAEQKQVFAEDVLKGKEPRDEKIKSVAKKIDYHRAALDSAIKKVRIIDDEYRKRSWRDYCKRQPDMEDILNGIADMIIKEFDTTSVFEEDSRLYRFLLGMGIHCKDRWEAAAHDKERYREYLVQDLQGYMALTEDDQIDRLRTRFYRPAFRGITTLTDIDESVIAAFEQAEENCKLKLQQLSQEPEQNDGSHLLRNTAQKIVSALKRASSKKGQVEHSDGPI